MSKSRKNTPEAMAKLMENIAEQQAVAKRMVESPPRAGEISTAMIEEERMTPEDINLAREWLASIESVGRDTLDPLIQRIVDTIEEALEIAMEHVLKGKDD